jgi:hypothetical protein
MQQQQQQHVYDRPETSCTADTDHSKVVLPDLYVLRYYTRSTLMCTAVEHSFLYYKLTLLPLCGTVATAHTCIASALVYCLGYQQAYGCAAN